MSSPERGRIVLVETLDPQGQNLKCRPMVIVTATEEIQAGKPFWGVAITGTLPNRLSSDYVELPWHNKGHPRTGLRKRCAALCTWLLPINHQDIRQFIGVVPGKELSKILERVNALQ